VKEKKTPSRHRLVYTESFPAIASALIISSIVYLSLELTQQRLDMRYTKADYEKHIALLEIELEQAQSTSAPVLPSPSTKKWWFF